MKAVHRVVMLHNIRSTHNVGAIFRTADAIGVEKIILTGYTPSPLDRFGNPRKDIAKSALGAEKTILWEAKKTIAPVLKKLKKEGYTIVAIEQSTKANDYKNFQPHEKTVFIFGNEVQGVSPYVLKLCDEILEIPMKGKKESLNVSVAAGIVLYRILDRA
jgi:tRNA G18 (ribose-2'-O)-methylase SpoU